MPAGDKLLKAVLRLELDKSAISAIQKGFGNVGKALRAVQAQAEAVDDAITRVGETAGSLTGVSEALIGQSSPLGAAMQTYVATVGRTEQASARYLASVKQMENAQIRLGRAAMQAYAPMQSKLADLVTTASRFIERHPELLRIATGAGGLALAAGTALTVATQIGSSIGQAVQMFSQLRGMTGIGGTLGAAGIAAAGLAASPFIGMAAGKGVASGLANAGVMSQEQNQAIQRQQIQDVIKTIAQLLFIAAYKIAEGLQGLADGFEQILYQVETKLLDLAEFVQSVAEFYNKEILPALDQFVKGIGNASNAIMGASPAGQSKSGSAIGPASANVNIPNQGLQSQNPFAAQFYGTSNIPAGQGVDVYAAPNSATQAQNALEDWRAMVESQHQTAREAFSGGGPSEIDTWMAGWEQGMEKFIDGLFGASQAVEQFNEGFTPDQLDQYAEHQRSMAKMELDYQQQMEERHNEFLRQQSEAERNYQRQIAQFKEAFQRQQAEDAKNFADQEAQAVEDYAAQRTDNETAYQEQIAEQTETFQDNELQRLADWYLQQQRAAEDHRDTIRDAARRLDAVAVIEEQQRYKKEQRRAKEDFDKESKQQADQQTKALKQAAVAYEKQQKAAEDNFRKQRQDAAEAYRKQQADAAANFERQLQDQQREHAYQMQEDQRKFQEQMQIEDQRHAQEVQQQDSYFRDSLSREIQHQQWSADQWSSYYSTLREQLNDFMSGGGGKDFKNNDVIIEGQGPPPGTGSVYQHQAGGYSVAGSRNVLHGGEFIANAMTTRMLERLVGVRPGGLSQSSLVTAIQQGMRSLTVGAIHNNIGDVGGYSRREIADIARRGAIEALTEVMENA